MESIKEQLEQEDQGDFNIDYGEDDVVPTEDEEEIDDDDDDDDDDDNDAVIKMIDDDATSVARTTTTGATFISTASTAADVAKSAQKKRDKAKKLLSRVNFARSMTLDKVIFGTNNTIVSIGGVPIKDWNSHMLPAFCRVLKINIPNKAKTRTDCINYIVNFKNSGDVRELLKTGGKGGGKKKSAQTRPPCAPLEGTLLRAILTVTTAKGKPIYLETNNKLSRDELDIRKGHEQHWGKLASMYNDETITELDSLGVDLHLSYGYESNEPSKFDKDLTGNDLRDIMRYINYWYGKARANKNLSGNHLPFKDFDFGHGRLYFLQLRLNEMGDTDLLNASYAELAKDVFAVSSGELSPISNISIVTSTSTSKTTKLEEQKEKVAASFVAKNKHASSLILLQKQQLALEVSQMLDKRFEELDEQMFDMKEELQILEVRLVCAGNSESTNLTLQRRKFYLVNKLNRGTKKLMELEIKMKHNELNNNN